MTHSLFASNDALSLEQKLNDAFEGWISCRHRSRSKSRSQKRLRNESIKVYRDMWQAFVAFCATRALDLHQLKTEDLETFLLTRGSGVDSMKAHSPSPHVDLSPRYARRFLSLIDWIISFQAKEDERAINTVAKDLLEQPQYKYANAADKDAPPEFLSDAQAKSLIAYVSQSADSDSATSASTWKEVRDRTAVAAMLGAGLSPGDVRNLKVSGVPVEGGRKAGIPWKLSLPGNGNFPARETPLANWAGQQLAVWLKVRAEHQIGGDYMFPATRDGRQWSHTRCFVSTRDVLIAAGLSDNAGGGVFKLRHTFALRQLNHGKSEVDVARWLGLLDVNGMAKYRRLLTCPVDVL